MELPKYYGLVQTVSEIGAAISGLFGSVCIIFGLAVIFNGQALQGAMSIGYGVLSLMGALVWLGGIYCFLAMVRAQIEMRNVVVEMYRDVREALR